MKERLQHKTDENQLSPRILVTGATGMIGSHLIIKLIEDGFRVNALYREPNARRKVRLLMQLYGKEALMERIRWVHGSLEDPDEWEHVLPETDAVIHAAAKVSFLSRDRHEMLETNFRGTARLVNTLLSYPKIYMLHISSIAALGGTGEHITEEAMWVPAALHSDYAVSKYLAEMEVWRGMQEGLKAGIINPSVVIGPPADACLWQNGFGSLVRDVARGKMRRIFPGVTGYVDVNDVTEIALRMLREQVSGERFIVSAENLSFEEIVRMIARELQVRPPAKTMSKKWLLAAARAARAWYRLTRKGPDYDLAAVNALYDRDLYDNSKVRSRFDYTFLPISRSIARTVDLYRKKDALIR